MTALILPEFKTFDQIAVEMKLAERDVCFKELSFACSLEAWSGTLNRARVELLAAMVELSSDSSRNIVDQWQERARCLNEANRIFKALAPHQDLIRSLVGVEEKRQRV